MEEWRYYNYRKKPRRKCTSGGNATTVAGGGSWWPEEEAEEGRDERGTRESTRERDTKWRCSIEGSFAWWLQWPEVVEGGRRVWWQWVQWRERACERESERERREMEVQHKGLVHVVVAMAGGGRWWPEGVVAVGATERERGEGVAEAQARGRRRVREIRTLNKPYGFGC
ncbi:hypothetical protein DEO72_LG1g2752 [Vigna unguiculata]|uniref:Uncharacterized protein n=1 Tax=Vigna unguiculata TaxID=3917 RepID=A0A4D6KRD2_VIGUN|nr:hypothetical protein DEO72_LG1g2752 [Vigna unguiculata]